MITNTGDCNDWCTAFRASLATVAEIFRLSPRIRAEPTVSGRSISTQPLTLGRFSRRKMPAHRLFRKVNDDLTGPQSNTTFRRRKPRIKPIIVLH